MNGVGLIALAAVACLLPAVTAAQPIARHETITLDAAGPTRSFPHFWEQMFGSGRAALTLRANYRHDLTTVKNITGFTYVRFHGILHDELGVYSEDAKGKAIYNFSYVDQVYDGLLASGVKPFVEISFMPDMLAAHVTRHSFWYKPDISPPKDYAKWDALVTAFVRHLIDRYGENEVASWYFEVWNEPNLDFWAGSPKQQTYFELYEHTARAIRAASAKLRVGGPATAQAAWVPEFIAHMVKVNAPLDFVSSHAYGDDAPLPTLGLSTPIQRQDLLCRAVKKVHDQIVTSAKPGLPLIWSEYNASYMNIHDVTDTVFMGPWLGETISKCDGLTQMMSYWTFSDVFEEQGVYKTPLYGGYGLLAPDNLPKPALNAIALFHRLGDRRIPVASDDILATRRSDGTLVIAAWNYAQAEDTTGSPLRLTLKLQHTTATEAAIRRLDSNHGDLNGVYEQMGSPRYPNLDQIKKLREAGSLSAADHMQLTSSDLTIDLPTKGLALIELR